MKMRYMYNVFKSTSGFRNYLNSTYYDYASIIINMNQLLYVLIDLVFKMMILTTMMKRCDKIFVKEQEDCGLGEYMTIHITPEPQCSYVSFESNIPAR